jgi:phosphomannomutase
MSEPIISVSGLRGIIGSELSPATATNYVAAFCSVLPKGKVILGRDGRTSGPMLSQAVSATLVGHGMDVLDADVISTPSLGVLVRNQKAVAGIQISASHNPPAYNGLKLFNAEGRVIPAAAGMQVLAAYKDRLSRWVDTESLGTYLRATDPHRPHLDSVLKTVNVDRIVKRKIRVLLDSNHGAGAMLGRTLLERLGCQLTILGEQPTGMFAHPPEPLAANLMTVSDAVKQGGYDVGFCQDPDADRLAVIDETGHYIGEEFTSVLCVYHCLQQNPGPVVTNCASSSMTAWLAKKYNVPYLRSKVGEANVVDKMLGIDAVYGGEGSGGPIDPRVGYVRDSFVGMAQILDFMASKNSSISHIVAELPQWAMIKDKMQLSAQMLKESIDLLQRSLQANQVDTEDGVRLDWDDRWLLLRGSNTEPIVRLIAEAPTEVHANALIQTAKKVLESNKA